MGKQDDGMGFRNPGEFNLALLGKQCWQLINDHNSLWAQVIKERYFLNCSFFEAKWGSQASWAWASFLARREVIVAGLDWKIMSREQMML